MLKMIAIVFTICCFAFGQAPDPEAALSPEFRPVAEEAFDAAKRLPVVSTGDDAYGMRKLDAEKGLDHAVSAAKTSADREAVGLIKRLIDARELGAQDTAAGLAFGSQCAYEAYIVFDPSKLTAEMKEKAAQKTCATDITAYLAASSARSSMIINSSQVSSSPAGVAAGQLSPEQSLKLVKQGKASFLAIMTTPVGAEIDVDGRKLGASPISFYLLKKDEPRSVSIQLAGYKSVTRKLTPDGKPISLAITLEKQ
jgi:PEGA domain